jgi:hypothetical protein
MLVLVSLFARSGGHREKRGLVGRIFKRVWDRYGGLGSGGGA